MIAHDLLHLNYTPAKLDIQTNFGSLQYQRATASMQLSREKGGLTIKNTPAKLDIDTFEARNSVHPTPKTSIEQYAAKGRQAASEATATYAQQGKRAMEAPIGEELITQFVVEAQFKDVKTNIGIDFIPKAPPEISYIPGKLDMHFEADRLHMDWRMNPQKFNIDRAEAKLSLEQAGRVDVEYTGQPMIVPITHDPSYKPIDIRA